MRKSKRKKEKFKKAKNKAQKAETSTLREVPRGMT